MKKTYNVSGMHCRSCEILIEDSLISVNGVQKAVANTKRGIVSVVGDDFADSEIVDAIRGAGYDVGQESMPLLRLNRNTGREIGLGLLFVIGLWIFVRLFNLDKIFIQSGQTDTNFIGGISLGLLAGFSSCMALVGGIILGISARFVEKHPGLSSSQKFQPHLVFNFGRVVGYTVLGGLLGFLGKVIGFSGSVLGIISIFAGLLMLYLGILSLEIFPRLSAVSLFPKSFGRWILGGKDANNISNLRVFIVGALTFFVPCGFTQAMQIAAAASGSFWLGSSILGGFALGTSVGLLGLGGLSATIKNHSWGRIFFKGMAIVVILLAFQNIANGYRLSGFKFTGGEKKNAPKELTNYQLGERSGELVVFKAIYDPNDVEETIKPNQFTAKKGDVVRIEIFAKEDGIGCMSSVMIPGLVDKPEYFRANETVKFEFKPERAGDYEIVCAMGVKSGTLVITE